MYDKKVNVVMSVYKPNIEYFKKQLISIDSQTYENIEVLIWNDCPEETLDYEFIKSCIKRFDVKIFQAKENLGYVKAFEKLTDIANAEYIAYCDQDDIWLSDKIEIQVASLVENKAVLATCDRMIIDENDNITVNSIRHDKKEREACWSSGDDITKYAIFSCYSIGMATVVRADIAKACIPFPLETAHDKWLTMCSSYMGKVCFVDKPLVKYRRHSSNESGVLSKITSKEEYYKERVDCAYRLTDIFLKKFPDFKDKYEVSEFAKARYEKNIFKIFKYRYLSPTIAKAEIVLKFMPNFIFRRMIAR